MIKMSELILVIGCLFKDLLVWIFFEDQVVVVLGEVDVGVVFFKLLFDYLLFIGVISVGKYVMCVVVENLILVILELGGKLLVIVFDSVLMKDVVEWIVFGKSFNVGQICVVFDYVLVLSWCVEEFVSQYKEVVQGFFLCFLDNFDYIVIINECQFGCFWGYFDDVCEKGVIFVLLFVEGQ